MHLSSHKSKVNKWVLQKLILSRVNKAFNVRNNSFLCSWSITFIFLNWRNQSSSNRIFHAILASLLVFSNYSGTSLKVCLPVVNENHITSPQLLKSTDIGGFVTKTFSLLWDWWIRKLHFERNLKRSILKSFIDVIFNQVKPKYLIMSHE